jgi:hypothetical protein
MAYPLKTWNGTQWVQVSSASTDLTNYVTKTGTTETVDFSGANFIPPTQTGFRNVLINGGFAIDQRNAGASQTITAGAANAYTVDRWAASCTGANITGARVAGAIPDQYYYRFTGAASNTQVSLSQRIEAANSIHLAGKTVTLSIKIASTSLTSINWLVGYAAATDNFGSITGITNGTFTISPTLTTYTATFTIPSAATTGIRILLQSTGLVATQTLTFAAAQLELGSVATPFETRPIGTELALCQRYYEKSYDLNVAPGTSTNDGLITQSGTAAGRTTGEIRSDVSFKVTKRIKPTTITIYDSAGNINKVTRGDYGTAFNTNQTVSIAYSGQSNFCMFSGGAGVFGSAHVLHFTADAEL